MNRIDIKQVILSDEEIDKALRPRCLDDFIGQDGLKEKLQIAIEAARYRGDPVPHILLMGSPGLGKTTIANIIAQESDSEVISVMAPSVKSVADILEILKKIEPNGILFIDEIHALDRKVEETLYSAMEDYAVSIKMAEKQILRIKINPFCLIGATTIPGKMTAPLRDRFDIQYTMQFYEPEELATIITANAVKLEMRINGAAPITDLSRRCRGTPRIANRLLKRVRDFAQVKNNNVIDDGIVEAAMQLEGIDKEGLGPSERKYLKVLFEMFRGGPVGLETMSASIQEDKSSTDLVIEPFLMRKGFIIRTKQGRIITDDAVKYLFE